MPRRDDHTLLPAVLAALLVAMIVLQLALTGGGELPPELPGRLRPAMGAATPGLSLADPVIAARPIFSPTRRGGAGAPMTGAAESEAPLLGAVVAGSMTGRGFAQVMLRLPDGTVRAVRRGGTYAGWRLVDIGPDRARFRKGDAQTALVYGTALPVAAAAAGDEDEPSDADE